MNRKNIFAGALLLLIVILPLNQLNAETVFVKYRGAVDLADFDCSNTSSSFVHRICYDNKNHYAITLLNGTYYHYCRMPSTVVEQWLRAGSKGQFYNRNIKGRFDCRLGGVPGK